MKITIELDTSQDSEELIRLLGMRDDLRDRVRELESTPLKFSLRDLAFRVSEELAGLTPDQRDKMKELIESG